MENLTVRDMTIDDVPGVSAVRIAGWKAAYAGMVPQDHLDGLNVEADIERRRSLFLSDSRVQDLVAERAGSVVGWAVVGPCRDEGRDVLDGELYALYVAPALIGTGVGRALVRESIARAEGAGFESLYLWVLEDNHRARRFYRRAGFSPDGERALWAVGGTSVPELRYFRALREGAG